MINSKYKCEGNFIFNIANNLQTDLFPNPIKNEITFNIEENNRFILIEIYNVNGKLLNSINKYVENNRVTLNMQNYSEGLYLIKLSGKTTRTHKIIKL